MENSVERSSEAALDEPPTNGKVEKYLRRPGYYEDFAILCKQISI